jgi:outer membrane receptor for ferrienterochelin and colicins
VRCPGSSIYGTNAFLGVVNVITASGATRPGLQVTAGGGSLGARDVAASFAHRSDSGYNLLFGVSTGTSDGIDRYPVTGQGTAVGLDGEESWKLFGTVTRGSWTIRGTYAVRDKNIPTGAFGVSLTDPRSRTEDGRGFVEAVYDAAWRGIGITWRSSYDHATYDGRYVYPSESEAEGLEPEISVDSTAAEWWTTEVMLTRRVSRQHFLTGGTEIRQNFRQDQLSHSFTTGEVWVDRKDHQHVFAAYVQDEFTVAPRLTITGGVRHDRYSETGSTNLRLAAIFKPRDRTALKVLHGNAFRAPNPYELYYYEGSTDLSPERITTSEVVWEQYLATRVRLSASAFYYHASDLITQLASVEGRDGFIFANIAEAKAPGVEFEAEGAWHEMHMLGSYTFQNVTDDRGDRLNNSPNHLMRARITGPIVPRMLFFGVEGLCIGDRRSVGGNLAKGRFLGNLTASTREVAHARLSVSIGNLFNKSYEDPGAEEHFGATIPQHGRTLRAQLAWRF